MSDSQGSSIILHYEGVAYFTEEVFEELLKESGILSKVFRDEVTIKRGRLLLPYMKIKNELGDGFPDALFAAISKKDVYELPMEENIAVISKAGKSLQNKHLRKKKSIFLNAVLSKTL